MSRQFGREVQSRLVVDGIDQIKATTTAVHIDNTTAACSAFLTSCFHSLGSPFATVLHRRHLFLGHHHSWGTIAEAGDAVETRAPSAKRLRSGRYGVRPTPVLHPGTTSSGRSLHGTASAVE